MKQLSICADDYAYSVGMSAAIRELILKRRISDTSVMTTFPIWQNEGDKLRDLVGMAQIGLHFDLTTQLAPLSHWLACSAMRCIDKQQIRDALMRQIESYESVMGSLPDHIDSHHHVHTFPQIRDVVCAVLGEVYPHKHVAVRSLLDCMPVPDAVFKAWVIRLFSKGFDPTAYGFMTNKHFAGTYSLSNQSSFSDHMQHWLELAPEGTLLTVHPGYGDAIEDDKIHLSRSSEYTYLSSDSFQTKLEALQIELVPFGQQDSS